ncbi:Non-specific serine/threonine protein kinase [Aphelenchoides bicaudatus]|nr:Non-specific serine/threonine protein kinase [Aphelenchoides bicaudatus]
MNWNLNKFAKNALLNAQKRIDSVLDIQAEEKVEVEDEEQALSNDEIDSTNFSALSDATEVESTNGNESIKLDGIDESFTTTRDSSDQARLVDIDLTADQTSGWDLDPSEDIVETEPNPIRDAHEQPSTSIYHYSPSSNSPDEDDHHQQTHPQNEHFDLSLINLEQHVCKSTFCILKEPPPGSVPPTNRAKFDRQHEDVITVASSDIVVIKNADDWSVASGSHRRTGSDQASVSASIQNQKNSDDESMHEKVLTLEAKLKHRDQRLEELSRANENLKAQNATLAQRNKQMSNKLTTEAKAQKQLTEKESELKDLMNEGQKLSKQIAKQSKELKRLREIEKEFEVLTLKFSESKEEVERRTELEIQLKDHLRRAEAKLDEKTAEIAHVQEKVHKKQEVADDLKMSEQRCQNQKLQIAKLEQRIDELMATQRASAEHIAELNAPLLANIEELESKLRESEAEKYVLQKKIRLTEENITETTRKSNDEINVLKQQLESLRNSNARSQEKIQRMKSDYDELSEKHKKVESLFQSVESKLLAETAELKELISKKDSEIMELKHELMAATNPKTPSPQKVAVPMEPHPDLLEDLHELERENNALRTQFNELQEHHDTLLLLQGESIVRVQELEEENQNIKQLCKEQALIVASLKSSVDP